MISEFALDLKTARRKAGLTQEDCAHLLSVSVSLYSQIETGKRVPTVREICTLSLIYGRSFESLFSGIFRDARCDLHERLTTIPDAPQRWPARGNRQHCLSTLAERLLESYSDDHAP